MAVRHKTINECPRRDKDRGASPKIDGNEIACRNEVLDLSAETPDPKRVVMCFEKSPTQLIGEVCPPVQSRPGELKRYDCE